MAIGLPFAAIDCGPGMANQFLNTVLTAARPGQFVGVELVNGVHADSFRTHNPIVQLAGSIAGLGFSRPENMQAVQELAEGWINDFYDGTHTGVYGELGSTVDIPDTGGARAYVLPAPAHQFTFIELIVEKALESLQVLDFAYCAEDPSAMSAAASKCSVASHTQI